jgi:ketosteroid isomerase-like protein
MSAIDTQDLTEISHQLLTAIRGRDANTLDRLLHGEFAQISEAGVRTKRDAFITAIATSIEITALSFDFLSVDVFGDTAVVCGVQRAVVRLQSGEEITSRSAFTDVFVKNLNRWLLRLATSVDLA